MKERKDVLKLSEEVRNEEQALFQQLLNKGYKTIIIDKNKQTIIIKK